MSYVGVGAVEPWGRNAAEQDEVYLWRATLTGANIRTQVDVKALADSGAKAATGLGLDLRGVTVSKRDDAHADVDLVFTSKETLIYPPGTTPSAADVGTRMKAALSAQFPRLTISNARWEQITDAAPKHAALDFWLSHYILWDTPAGSIPMLAESKPTHASALFKGLYQGRAEDGIKLKKWPKDEPFTPGGGGSGSGLNKDDTIWWVLGFGALAWIAYHQSQKPGAAR